MNLEQVNSASGLGMASPEPSTSSHNCSILMPFSDSNTSELNNVNFDGLARADTQAQGQDTFIASTEQNIPNEIRLKYNSQRKTASNPLIDVQFVFDGAKLGAHKIFLLDGPVYEYFYEQLNDKKGLVVIDVPLHITVESVDAILNHIYGVPVNELGITEENIDAFLDAAIYFKMDVKFFPKLLTVFKAQSLHQFIANNFERLSTNSEFWLMENRTILELCQALNAEIVEDAFLDWIYANKASRKQHLIKLLELRQMLSQDVEFIKEISGNQVQGGRNTDQQIPEHLSTASNTTMNQAELIVSDEQSSSNSFETKPSGIFAGCSRQIRLEEVLEIRNLAAKIRPTSPNVSVPIGPIPTNSAGSHLPVVRIPTGKFRVLITPGTNATSSPSASLANNFPKECTSTSKKRKKKYDGYGRRKLGIKIKKPRRNNLDLFFLDLLNSVKQHLDHGTTSHNQAFIDSWTTIWKYTDISQGRSRKKNVERFLEGNGMDLLFASRVKFSDENMEINQLLLCTIENLAEPKEFRHLVYTDRVVTYVLKELQNFNHFKNSTTAGEILSYFLNTYGPEEWTLETSREIVSDCVREAIIEHWDFKWDRCTYITDKEEITDFIELVTGNDSTARLCGLWSLAYYTITTTMTSKRDANGNQNLAWLKQANCTDVLQKFALQKEDNHKSEYAEMILDHLDNFNIS